MLNKTAYNYILSLKRMSHCESDKSLKNSDIFHMNSFILDTFIWDSIQFINEEAHAFLSKGSHMNLALHWSLFWNKKMG